MEKTRVYSLFSEKVSPAGISDKEEEEGREEDEGEAVDVMIERREAVEEGTTEVGVARAFVFL